MCRSYRYDPRLSIRSAASRQRPPSTLGDNWGPWRLHTTASRPSRRLIVANTFPVEVVSVEAKVWTGEAEMVVARTTEGELGVLAGHAPLLGQLKEPSRVRVKKPDGDEVAYDVAGGFLSVTYDMVT